MKPKYYKWSGWYVKVLSAKKNGSRKCLHVYDEGAIELGEIGDGYFNGSRVVKMEEISMFEFNEALKKVHAKIEKAVSK